MKINSVLLSIAIGFCLQSFVCASADDPSPSDKSSSKESRRLELNPASEKQFLANPKVKTDYLNLGITLGRQGQYKLAIAAFDQAIALHQNEAEAYCYRGRTFGLLGLYGKEIRDGLTAISLAPLSKNAYLPFVVGLWGYCFWQEGDPFSLQVVIILTATCISLYLNVMIYGRILRAFKHAI